MSFESECEAYWRARDKRDLKRRRKAAERNPTEHLRQLGWCGLQEQWWREDWLHKNPEALSAVLEGLEQAKAGELTDGPDLDAG